MLLLASSQAHRQTHKNINDKVTTNEHCARQTNEKKLQ